ncbi:DUF4157 domain-containing protein [Geodermatophilus sp. SYSU D01180]
MTPARAVAERRPAARRTRSGDRTPPRGCLPGGPAGEVGVHRFDRITIQEPAEQRAGRMLDAALAEPVHGLPYAAALEQHFGQPLGWIRVRSGPLVTDALNALGATAATRGDDVFLRAPSAPLDVVAHEVTHALQARRGGPGPGGIVDEHAAPEVEALRALRAPVGPTEGLALSAIALLLQSPPITAEPTIAVEPEPAPEPAPPPSVDAAPPSAPAAEGPAPAETAGPTRPAPGIEAGAAPAGGETAPTGEAFALAPAAQPTVSAEEVAAREAAAAEAAAPLTGAGSARDLLETYVSAAPTVKAQQAASLSEHLNTVLPAETREWQSAVPPIEASLPGTDDAPPASLRVELPPAAEVRLEPGAVAPAPEPELAEVPEAAPFTANDRVSSAFGHLTAPAPEQLADAIGETLSEVRTTDPSVPRTPGPPPAIPLGGETDPERIAAQQAAGATQAAAARDEAVRAVVDGPGPEQVQPAGLQESYAVEPVEPPAPATLAVPDGPQAYLALGLPPEVQLTFDEQQQTAMQESMAEAAAKADEATITRDAARDEAVATAQQGAAELNETAQAEQTAAVTDARTTIQAERQSAIDAQQAEVERIRGEAAGRRQADEAVIDRQVQTEQQAIDGSYVAAESDIAAEVTDGERRAQEERARAEREAEDESWWDRAVSFVKDAFDALVSAIGEIFDAVRAAVNAALDALKSLALSVIDRLATFIKDAIAAFGEFLKSAIDTLVGTFFPELAARLNAAIDAAVAAARAAVDVVAEGLKAGISALVEGLRAGINAALDAYEAAIGFALSVVGAALTGDWGAVARKVLEAVLGLVGVDPEAFYAFVGRAQETLELIVDNPLGFLSNLVDAFVGGVQGFADRFGEHLRNGVIGWLTGTLGSAGITVPQTFDLFGMLDLARQVLGLTWERIRAKAVKLIGERNVARLEFIGGYITTLVNEGWSGLWEKIKADLSSLTDMVFDGIKSFLLDRVVLAVIKKIPALFGPVGAIVQLVMTAWNLYEFLRDQLARIAGLVKTVVDSIGDIARGVLTAATAKVEAVLGDLVPIALDLLARLLGLGNVGEDVREVIQRVQAFIDRAIDALITRVIGLFTGRSRAGAAADGVAARAGTQSGQQDSTAPVAAGAADPQVKVSALAAAYTRATQNKLATVEALNDLIDGVHREFKPRGLAALWFDVTNEATLQGRFLATASDPEQRVIAWKEIFDPLDPDELLFAIQPRNETHAALSVDGNKIGTVALSEKGHHAEENLIATRWDAALDVVRAGIALGKRPRLALAINRAPCYFRCAPLLIDVLTRLDPALKSAADFVLAPTGVYEPTERLTEEEIQRQRDELTAIAETLGRPASAVIREYLSRVRVTDDATTFNDLRALVAAGWDLRQLQARPRQTSAGRELAIAAHSIAVQAEKAKAGKS